MYVPNPVPFTGDAQEMRRYLEDELNRINEAIADGQETFKFESQNTAPVRPRAGMLAYADGTNWNPGSGEGVYLYTSGGTWSKL